jgi:hypothetical protein
MVTIFALRTWLFYRYWYWWCFGQTNDRLPVLLKGCFPEKNWKLHPDSERTPKTEIPGYNHPANHYQKCLLAFAAPEHSPSELTSERDLKKR